MSDELLKAVDDAMVDAVKRLFSVYVENIIDGKHDAIAAFERGMRIHIEAAGKAKAAIRGIVP